MKADWIEIKRGDTSPQNSGIYATMNPMGTIVINRPTYEMLDSPAAFLVLYDKANNRIGLKPAGLLTRNAYRTCVAGRQGGKKVHAYRLVAEQRISLRQAIQFADAEIDEDGILVLDLRTAKISARSMRHDRNRIDGQALTAVEA